MGGRLIKQWIGAPLIDLTSVKLRQDAVSWFHDSSLRRDRMQGILASISDLERLVNKIRSNTASPRDLLALGRSLKLAPKIRNLLLEEEINYRVEWIAKEIEDIREVDSRPSWMKSSSRLKGREITLRDWRIMNVIGQGLNHLK